MMITNQFKYSILGNGVLGFWGAIRNLNVFWRFRSVTYCCIREVFDNISMQVISFLENHIGITDVEFIERAGCADISLQKWEEENAPIRLPDDYKAFL